MRLDRSLTLSLFNRFPKKSVIRKGIYIPILMYHSVSDSQDDQRHPYFKTNTIPSVFEEHMKLLHERNFSVITLSHAVNLMSANAQVFHLAVQPDSQLKFVVLTFDDGFEDFYTHAFPILQRYEFAATMFLPTGFISDKRVSFKGKNCMNWNEIQTLSKAGVEFGGHTVSHPELRFLSWNQIESEIRKSREIIQEKIGKQVRSFSYPYAFPEENNHFKARLRNSLAEAGYTSGVTTIIGTACNGKDQLFLPRIPVNSDDDQVFFLAKLEGGYDWMHGLQQGFKLLKRSMNVWHKKYSISVL